MWDNLFVAVLSVIMFLILSTNEEWLRMMITCTCGRMLVDIAMMLRDRQPADNRRRARAFLEGVASVVTDEHVRTAVDLAITAIDTSWLVTNKQLLALLEELLKPVDQQNLLVDGVRKRLNK